MKLRRNYSPTFAPLIFVSVVDVAAALAFFFLLSGTFLLQPGIAVTPPVSPFMLSPQRNPGIVAITSSPAPGIYFENQRVSIEEFDRLLVDQASLGVRRSMIIKADKDAPAGLVVDVSSRAIERGFSVVLATAAETE